MSKVRKLMKLCSKWLVCACLFAPTQTWAQMTPQQFEKIKAEYHALKLARAIDEQCYLLSSPPRIMAEYKGLEIKTALRKVGITDDDFQTFEASITAPLMNKSCDEISQMPNTKAAAETVNFSTGLGLYAWQQLYEKYGIHSLERQDCGGRNKHDLIRDAVADQSYLIERFKEHPNFKAVCPQVDITVQQVKSICAEDGGFFRMTYGGSAMFNIIPHIISLKFALEPAPDAGYFEKSANSQKWQGFRGSIPEGDYDAKVPWAVLREAREKNPKSTGLSEYFVDNSSVDFGLTRDQTFVFSIRTPSLAEFEIDIFKAVVMTDTKSGQAWRLPRTKNYYVGYDPAYLAKSGVKAEDLPATAQFEMSQADSAKVIAAIKAGHGIKIEAERLEAGRTRLVEVETISQDAFVAAMKYAFAKKIAS